MRNLLKFPSTDEHSLRKRLYKTIDTKLTMEEWYTRQMARQYDEMNHIRGLFEKDIDTQ
jgi:hypothetical protein